MFAAAVFGAKLLQADSMPVSALCISFVVLRALYITIYISHEGERLAALRSIVFVLALFCVVALFVLGLAA